MIRFDEYVEYDENSPSGLVWKKDITGLWHHKKIIARKGDVAGSLTSEGYWQVKINKDVYRAHRVVWEICIGAIGSNEQLDHINRDRADNRIENLRISTQAENMQNRSKNKNNTTGITGVCWLVKKDGSISAQANWKHMGVKGSKSFSAAKYGLLPAFHLACEYRKGVIEGLNSQGASYSATHGK